MPVRPFHGKQALSRSAVIELSDIKPANTLILKSDQNPRLLIR